ncbi:MAG: Gfo/Idh/MocA family oxidoreductase [Gammaproteobacteria bacterium]|nr:Gfo/Idh/MocA family oxidoreductase [Gammaproteobacteria bacterium]
MKVGLCGLGDRLSYVAKVMSDLIHDFDVIAYADPASVKIEYMQSNGIKMNGYDDLTMMMKNEKIDLLMVGSPNHMHLEHIRIGLEYGVKIFTEKPVVTTEEQTFAMLDLLKKHNAVDDILVGMVLRYSPLYKDLKSSIEMGQLGELTSIETSEHIAPEHGAFFMRDWRRQKDLSGGFMLEKCCHDLDIYQGAIESRPFKIVSFGGKKTFIAKNKELGKHEVYHERKSRWGGIDEVFDNDSQLIDHQTALIEYENGVNLSFHTNLNVPDEYRHFSVFGTKGMAEGDFVRNYYKVHDAISSDILIDKTYQHDDSISMHYGAEEQMAADWIAYFHEEKPLPVSILDALEAGLTAIKLDESRETGKIIDMTDTWAKFDSYGLHKITNIDV